MKAMLLAAGRGARMKACVCNQPKPLLSIGDTTLIEHNLIQLKAAGFHDVVINISHFGEQIKQALGDGARYGLHIQYSVEVDHPLETGGGVYNALDLLGDEPFLVLSADIWTNYPFAELKKRQVSGAHLVMVDNPDYHTLGDFCLEGEAIELASKNLLTYANIAVLHPGLFDSFGAGVYPLLQVFKQAIQARQVTGEQFYGEWFNVGTPDILHELRRKESSKRL